MIQLEPYAFELKTLKDGREVAQLRHFVAFSEAFKQQLREQGVETYDPDRSLPPQPEGVL